MPSLKLRAGKKQIICIAGPSSKIASDLLALAMNDEVFAKALHTAAVAVTYTKRSHEIGRKLCFMAFQQESHN